MTQQQQIKVLVIRFSSIGDIVLTTPVVRCLKKVGGTDVEVHYVTKKMYRDLIEGNPHVDRLHLLDGSLYQVIKRLRSERFDFVIDLHHNIRSAMVKTALQRPSGSFRKLNFEKWLLTRCKVHRLPPTHIVDRYFDAAAFAGVENDGGGLEFFFPGEMVPLPADIPAPFYSKGFIAFVIGGKHATKRLPNEKIVAVCKRLHAHIVLLGDVNDASNAQEISAACGDRVYNACGRYGIHQSAALVRESRLVISHDTGLMHIAAAFQKHVISVWGNTVPEFGMYPYMPEHPGRSVIVEVKGLPCRPCTKIGYTKCPKGHFDCMQKIDVDRIAGEAERLLEQPNSVV